MTKRNKVSIFNERMIQGHGVDVVIDLLAKSLANSGYRVTIHTLFTDNTFENKQYEIEIIAEKPRTLLEKFIGRGFSDMAARDLNTYLNKKYFSSIDADLFIINSYPFFPILRIAPVPCLVIDYGVASSRYLSLRHQINRFYANFSQKYYFFGKAAKILPISNYIKSLLPKKLLTKAETVHLGADTYASYPVNQHQIEAFKAGLGLKKDDFLLLYVGRLNTQTRTYKDIHELIKIYQEARQKNPQINLAMLGFGHHADEVALKAQGVIPLLNRTNQELAIAYHACDLYITATKWEGFNLPLAEAQYFGKPVIAYDLCAHPELCLNGKTGYLVITQKEFVTKILQVAQDAPLHQSLSQQASLQGQLFSWKKTTDRYVNIVGDLLANTS